MVVEAKLRADYVEVWHEGVRVAQHERCYSRQQKILDLEHLPSTFCGRSRVHWQARPRWHSGVNRDVGLSVLIDYGKR